MQRINNFLLSNEEFNNRKILINIIKKDYILEKVISKSNSINLIDQISKILLTDYNKMAYFKEKKLFNSSKLKIKFDYIFLIIEDDDFYSNDSQEIINKIKVNFKKGSKVFISKSNKENIINYQLDFFNKNNIKSQNLYLSDQFLLYDYLYFSSQKIFTKSNNIFKKNFLKLIKIIYNLFLSIDRINFLADKIIIKYIFLPYK